jgi:methyl-accepting chemotaxis protein
MKYISNFIGNLGINTKLGLIMGLPMLGMLVLAIMVGTSNWGQMQRLVLLKRSADLNVHIGNLVHEMQKERGASAGFLGSKGAKFGSILQGQRSETNRTLSELKGLLKDLDMSALTDEGAEAVKLYMRNMEDLSGKRSKVDGLNISVAEQVGWYTKMNKEGLHVIAEGVHAAYDPALTVSADLSMMVASYYAFLEMKERSGVERAVFTGVFAANKLAQKKRDKLMTLISEQSVYEDIFLNLAEDGYLEYYRKSMTESGTAKAVAEVERMREIGFSRNDNFGVDSEHWFKSITTKINGLHAAELLLTEDLLSESGELSSHWLNFGKSASSSASWWY